MKVELKNVEETSKEMFEIFTRHNKEVKLFMSRVSDYYNKENNFLNIEPEIQILKEDAINYLQDGNTKTPGLTWSAFWIIPLSNKGNATVNNFLHDYCGESIIFHLSNYDQRLVDGKIKGCKFFDLSFKFGGYKEIATLGDGGSISKDDNRIAYQNNNYPEMVILNKLDSYTKLILYIDKFNEILKIENKLNNLYSNEGR